jgi:hypothetical protein
VLPDGQTKEQGMKPAAMWMAATVTMAGLVQAQAPAPVAAIERQKAPATAEAYIISPADGATVQGPVVVRFGLKGMGIAPAGIKLDNTGHHHLFVDTDLPADLGAPIPAVEGKVLHFGKGQTEVELTLAPGKHTLQLLVGDYLHIPLDPAVASKKVTITVKP